MNLDLVLKKMIAYDAGDARRIQHAGGQSRFCRLRKQRGGRCGRGSKCVFGICGAGDAADAPRGSAGAERVAEAHCGLRALRAGDRCGRL